MKKNRMGKWVFSLLILMILISQSCLIALADVVWEPDTDFYRKHKDECIYVDGLKTIANGPGGSVTVWESPVSDKVVVVIENGNKVTIDYTYIDKLGHEWGLVYRGDYSGWVPMEYLASDPKAKSFSELYGDEVQDGSQDIEVPEGVENIYLYTFPGSGELKSGGPVNAGERINTVLSFIDKDERQWGYVVYFRAMDGWLCLSDPGNDKIPADEAVLANAVMPAEPDVIITPKPEKINLLIPALILVVVVAGAVILIRVISKRTAKPTE